MIYNAIFFTQRMNDSFPDFHEEELRQLVREIWCATNRSCEPHSIFESSTTTNVPIVKHERSNIGF
jgi:hypothetical protein